MRRSIAHGILLSMLVVGGRSAWSAPKKPKASTLVRVADVKLQTSVLAPPTWTVRFMSADAALLTGAHGSIGIRVARQPTMKPDINDVVYRIQGKELDDQIVAGMGAQAVSVGKWHCLSKLSDTAVPMGVCMKVIDHGVRANAFDVAGVTYQASGPMPAEFDGAALAAIGDGARGFDSTRKDPRDDRAAAIVLVSQPVPGTAATVLAPEDWQVAVAPDGVLVLTAPARPDWIGLTHVPARTNDAAGVKSYVTTDMEGFTVDDWTCGRAAAAGSCFHFGADTFVDLRLDFELSDVDQMKWIQGTLGKIGGSVPVMALAIVVPPAAPVVAQPAPAKP